MHETSDSVHPPRPIKNNTSISDCPESFAKWYCLNGATCFSVKIRDSTLYNCWCPIGFHGLRCDYKYVERRRFHQTSESHSKPAFRSHTTQGNNRAQHDAIAIAPPQQAKEIHLMIIYNMIAVLLIFLIFVLTMRTLKKRGLIIKTMGRTNEQNSGGQPNNDWPINQNCTSIEFVSMKQGQSQHQDRSRAEKLQNQELLRQEQKRILELNLHQQQLRAQQQPSLLTHWNYPMGFTTDHQHHQQRSEPV